MLWNALRRPATAGIIGIAAIVGAAAPGAHAQMVFTATQSIGDGQEAPISSASVRRYSQLLSLDETQDELLRSLYDGYAAAAAEAAAEFQDAMLGARQAFEDTGDGSVFMEVMPEAREKRSQTLKRLEAQFFEDVGMLLTAEQAQRRPSLERLRRREVLLPNGTLSGESVDLIEIVDSISLEEQAKGALGDTLTQYEVELDRSLVSRKKVEEETREALDLGRGGLREFGPEQMEKMEENAAKVREASLNVKSVNDRFARIIASQLPDADRDTFESTFHRKSFPQVYRTSSVEEALGAAANFGDLTTDQRQAIDSLLAAHERQVAAANRRWAQAIEESEQSEDGAAMAFGGGMMIRMGPNDAEGPVGEARKSRREIDQRTREKLLAALTEDQRERLPKRREREGQQWVPGGGVVGHQMIIEIEEDGGGGG